MRNLFRTTGLLSLAIWAAFFIVGITNGRPVIMIIAGLFFALTLFRRVRIRKTKAIDVSMWEAYTDDKPELKEYPYKIWRFDESDLNKNVIEMIETGKIRGESFSTYYFEANNQPIPGIGDYNVVIYGMYAPCIVHTVDIIETTWGQVDDKLASIEGISSAKKWRSAKQNKFQLICDNLDYQFNDELEIFFEVFQVVYTGEDYKKYLDMKKEEKKRK